MNVSATGFLEIEHVGGPFDGQTHRVPADEDGNPPEFITVPRVATSDPMIDPSAGIQAGIATQFYERDVVTRGDELRWVYVWKGETVTDVAA